MHHGRRESVPLHPCVIRSIVEIFFFRNYLLHYSLFVSAIVTKHMQCNRRIAFRRKINVSEYIR